MIAPLKTPIRHFLDIDLFSRDTLGSMIRFAHLLKKQQRFIRPDLAGKTLGLIFEKPSTRTRVSFECAMRELGGYVTSLTGDEMQLGHGETIGDTARVLSRFVHGIVLRTFAHENLEKMAEASSVPVINGLTDMTHPCQVMADMMTLEERFHRISGLTVAWCGDGDNNVLNSWMHAAHTFNFELRIACPAEYAPDRTRLKIAQAKANVTVTENADQAVKGANVVVTDSWVSMHHEDADQRRDVFPAFQVDATRMKLAKPDAIFMHCLPAHRGEEVTDEVMDGPQSIVWNEAENRLHIQKAILMWCFNKIPSQ